MLRDVTMTWVAALAVSASLFAVAPAPTSRWSVKQAIEGCDAVARALEMYRLDNGKYPASLDVLTRQQPWGGPALLKSTEILDPWGRRYAFDAKGTRNKGKVVDVWSGGPAPGNPAKRIGNWQLDTVRK